MRAAIGALVAIFVAVGAASAQDGETVVGEATVVDSDGLRVGETSVMLWGIESLERTQRCTIGNEIWDCYEAAIRALQTIASVAEVSCNIIGEPDGYGRVLGVCTSGGVDINEALVRAGFALAKRDETEDYVPAEEAAQEEGIGLWQGEFIHPADYRRSRAITQDRP